jgi:putative membrane protein
VTDVAVEPVAAVTRRAADADSRARTHLANERTFLAWLRTGLSLVAVGLAVAGFLPVDLTPGIRYVTVFAVLLAIFGTAFVLYGANRYIVAYRQIEIGVYRPAVRPVVAFAIVVAALGLMAIPIVVLVR